MSCAQQPVCIPYSCAILGCHTSPTSLQERVCAASAVLLLCKTQRYTPSDNKTAEGSAALNRHRHRTTVNFLLCQTCRIVQYRQAVAQLPHACQHGSVAVDVGVAARLNDLCIFPTCRVYVFISAFIKCLPRNLCPHLALSYVYGYEFTATLSFIVGKGTFAAYALYRQAIFYVNNAAIA